MKKNPPPPQSMDLYGQALLDWFNGDHASTLIMHRDDGCSFELPVSIFFAGQAQFSTIEQLSLNLCVGCVLDIGAGTGRHSLILQEKGLDVTAIDISPAAVDVMKKNGLQKTAYVDIFEFHNGRFDTLLLLGHGIGMTGTIEGLKRFLVHAHSLINPGGILVFDSLDVRCTNDPANLVYQENNRLKNRYIGEIHLQFEYKGQKGKPWSWLQVDPETLTAISGETGWDCEIIHREPWGDYLAKLNEK